ncbi:hypothetical protein [Nocardioides panzhihuensis]|uniref:Uncharacterized protein n=1 Tax=Nocardioides panzhihuensis TaxID=860243 RepID=A0A7Z0ISE6_9ACTN|nr:hypothetical protein [Nocardioides panzhihuensis]NYI77718.1 hypothetical protein [Nocardioides panzhihuensis]
MNDPETSFRTALHERVADQHPDYARISAGAISAGSRIRRRRRITVTVGAAAAVAAFAAGGLGLSQLLNTTAVDQAPLGAAAPSASASTAPLASGQSLDVGDGVTGQVVTNDEAKTMDITVQAVSGLRGAGTGFTIVLSGPAGAVEQKWSNDTLLEDYPGVRIATEGARKGLVDKVPVEQPPGWTCEWSLIDDKASCTSEDGGVAGLAIRPAKDYQVWSTSPDKAGPGSGAYLTEVHGDIFISVQSGEGTTDAELEAFASSLRWTD